MELDFLSPLDQELVNELQQLNTQHLASKVVFHTQEQFPDVSKVSIGIIGVMDNRGMGLDAEVNLNHIRKKLYSLYPGNWTKTIADFGDIIPGNTIEDTYFALQKVASRFIKNKIIPVVIGGSQDLTYALYRSYDQLEQMVNMVSVDNKFDFGKEEGILPMHSYLSKIIMNEPNNLFNYSNVGFQTYYNSQEEIDLIEKLYFDAYRLGEVSKNISIAEPVFRDADLVSIDLNVVKSSDSANFINFEPNGFDGKEICALSRYAGISDKVSCFGLFNHHSSKQEAVLMSQIVWYFIEGVNFRSNEYPYTSKDSYLKYIVPLDDEDLVFYKSDKSDRWWIEIKIIASLHNKTKNTTLLPCTHDDYLAACNGEIPERWWKIQRKSMV